MFHTTPFPPTLKREKRTFFDFDLWNNNPESFINPNQKEARITNYYEGVAQFIILAIFSTVSENTGAVSNIGGLFDTFFSEFTLDSSNLSMFIDFVVNTVVTQLNEELKLEGNKTVKEVTLTNIDTSNPSFFTVTLSFTFSDNYTLSKTIKLKK